MISRTRARNLANVNPGVAKVLREMEESGNEQLRSLAAHLFPHFEVLSDALGQAMASQGFETLEVASKANAVLDAALKELGRQVPGLEKAIDPGHSVFGNRLENLRRLSERKLERTPEPTEEA
jgi:hypothetical protein